VKVKGIKVGINTAPTF